MRHGCFTGQTAPVQHQENSAQLIWFENILLGVTITESKRKEIAGFNFTERKYIKICAHIYSLAAKLFAEPPKLQPMKNASGQ